MKIAHCSEPTSWLAIVLAIGSAILLELRLVYENFPFRRMAIIAATGSLLTGIALWCCWRTHAWYAGRRLVSNEAQRAGFNSTFGSTYHVAA